MRARPSVWTRTRRLEAAVGDSGSDRDEDTLLRRLVEEIAAERGVPVAVLLAEAEAAVARYEESGPITRQAMVERVAAEHGVDPDEVWAELAAMGLRWDG